MRNSMMISRKISTGLELIELLLGTKENIRLYSLLLGIRSFHVVSDRSYESKNLNLVAVARTILLAKFAALFCVCDRTHSSPPRTTPVFARGLFALVGKVDQGQCQDVNHITAFRYFNTRELRVVILANIRCAVIHDLTG